MDVCTSVDARETQELLDQARDDRVKMIVVPAAMRRTSKSVGGTLVNKSKSGLRMELTSLGKLFPDAWQGTEVTCYFELLDAKRGCGFYYNFTSKVASLVKEAGVWVCMVDWPKELQLGQRRSSMRIVPDPANVLGLSMWPEERFMFRSREDDKVKLHPPVITSEHLHEKHIQVLDISAGGLKVRFSGRVLGDIVKEWNQKTSFILWLVLLEPKKQEKIVCWFKARGRYAFADPVSKDVVMGLELTAHGIKENAGKLAWKAVEQNNVKLLSAWTYDRYREGHARGLR
jgi:hypothetical protein